LGIFDVDRDVPAVLPEPPQGDGGAVPVALTPERHGDCRRDEELKQRATEEREGFAAEGEDQVPGLVDREIEAIQPSVVGWCPKTLPSVNRQDRRECGAPASFRDRVLACVLQMASAVCSRMTIPT
jgi:hypothetical protein